MIKLELKEKVLPAFIKWVKSIDVSKNSNYLDDELDFSAIYKNNEFVINVK